MASPLTQSAGTARRDDWPPASKSLHRWLEADPRRDDPARRLEDFCRLGFDELPLPGHGGTLARWQRLALLSRFDLSFAKLVEAHTDTVAILCELGASPPPGARLAIWASEPLDARLRVREQHGRWAITGRKSWCSGAWQVSHALVTGWNSDGEQCLALVDVQSTGVCRGRAGWSAIGMAATESVDVDFTSALGEKVGAAGAYTGRPGFWHGAMGIAACWYGASTLLADALRRACAEASDPHRDAQLGRVDASLFGARSALRDAARQVDAAPGLPHQGLAMRLRALVEAAAATTIDGVGRALGATPFCRDASFARHMADLPVFLRQSHAERDLAGLARQVVQERADAWAL